MSDGTATKTKTTREILAGIDDSDVLQEIFADVHPGLTEDSREISTLFRPESAADCLARLAKLEQVLSESDTYQATVKKIQDQIDQAELMRNELLAKLFDQIRPIERSYRQLMLFFENCQVPDGKVRKPVELYVFNADSKAITDIFAATLAAVELFVRSRNDNFNFRDDVCNLVVPGYLPQPVREKLEDLCNAWGMLLITDIDDEKNFANVERNFLAGGKYEFMKRPEDRAAADVVTMGYLQLRPAHWFEKNEAGGDDLYGPASLVFAGALARTDDALGIHQGPIGSRFGQVVGSDKCRIEPLVSEMEHVSMERQLIPIIRDADNHLCFFGCRNLADDPYGVNKFFTSYRVLRYIERCCRHYLLQVAGQVLTRQFMEQSVEMPLRKLMNEQTEQGTILGFELFVDKDYGKRMQGICDITLTVMPTGPAEKFELKIDVPEFKPAKKGDS